MTSHSDSMSLCSESSTWPKSSSGCSVSVHTGSCHTWSKTEAQAGESCCMAGSLKSALRDVL